MKVAQQHEARGQRIAEALNHAYFACNQDEEDIAGLDLGHEIGWIIARYYGNRMFQRAVKLEIAKHLRQRRRGEESKVTRDA